MSRLGEDRRRALAAARLYLVVTPSASPGWERALRSALATGVVGVVQLRAKDVSDEAFLALAVRWRPTVVASGALWVLNDRPHLVARSGADGAHVGEGDPSPEEARALLGPDLLVGLSTHDEAELAAAARRGADYAGLGPCFPTETKRLRRTPGGADLVRRCLPAAGALPCFPIGGITPENAADLVAAGATRLAVGSAVLDAPDPAAAALTLDRILRGACPR